MSNALIIIPARMAATRLPGKPLADLCGEPMIVHVWRRAQEAAAGAVLVATDSAEIAQAVEAAGGQAVMTRADHMSGSDRVYEAACLADPEGAYPVVINLQGDLPLIEPRLLRAVLMPLERPEVDIATLAAEIIEPHESLDPNVVKVIGSPLADGSGLNALYFTRAPAPFGPGPLYHHIGLYAFRRAALQRFVALAPSPLEQRERLEQLRALEAGMRIGVACIDTIPFGVDTPADLERARALMCARQQNGAASASPSAPAS